MEEVATGLHENFVRGMEETSMCWQLGLDAIQKYASADAAKKPKLNKLGTAGVAQDQDPCPGGSG